MASTEEDVSKVILHQFARTPQIPVPNLSPPCLKLETFLRMTKIPYKIDTCFKASSKGKFPWIEHKGKAIADSAFCIQYLSKEFGVDVDSHLSEEQKAIATAFRVMLEENTYWTLVYYRWCTDFAPYFRNGIMHMLPTPIRHLAFWKVQRGLKDSLHGHGIGRHTAEEIYCLGERDLRAASVLLGSKKFLFGDEPCLTDLTLFALVSNFIWTIVGSPQENVIKAEMQNLVEHAKRIKKAYFPDWNEIIAEKDEKKRKDANSK